MRGYFNTYIAVILDFKRLNCQEIVPIPELAAVRSLCKLLECLATKENIPDPSDEDLFQTMTKLWFIFW